MLAVLPARGGSKRLVNKNLRLVGGVPMLLRRLRTLEACPYISRVVVSSDSQEILSFARVRGYEAVARPAELAEDRITSGEVVADVVRQLDWQGPVMLAQPTSPLVSVETLERACEAWGDRDAASDSLIAVDPGAPIVWRGGDHQLVEPLNRQDLAEAGYATENGALFIADASLVVETLSMRGDNPILLDVDEPESIDVDTHADLAAARQAAERKRIHMHVDSDHGLGHLHRCVQLAEHLDHHHLTFSFTDPTVMPYWNARFQRFGQTFGPGIVRDAQRADLLVHDALDSNPQTIHETRAAGTRVVTLEDLGPGSDHADLVVNELYRDARLHAVTGPDWAVLRPEFHCLPDYTVRERPERVLLLFGGTDEAGLRRNLGPPLWDALPDRMEVGGLRDGESVAEAMCDADLLVTSCGRTVNEACAVGIPTIAIAANHRETRHWHHDAVVYAGLHATVTDQWVAWSVQGLLKRPELRREISDRMRTQVDGRGAERLSWRIEGMLRGLE